MNIKTTLSATEVRNNFFEILDKVEQTNVPYTITRAGKPKAVIMNAEEYESWTETLDIMSDPETVKNIEESKKEMAALPGVQLNGMFQVLRHVLCQWN